MRAISSYDLMVKKANRRKRRGGRHELQWTDGGGEVESLNWWVTNPFNCPEIFILK
jgi:hypothetical protein